MKSNTVSLWAQEQIPEYQYLSSGLSGILAGQNSPVCPGVNADSYGQVEAAAALGLQAERIYFSGPKKQAEDILRAIGKCRFVADSWDELQRIDQMARLDAQERTLVPVGLRVIPEHYDDGNQPGLLEKELPDLAQKIKTLPAISVRGCFVQGRIGTLHGDALGRYFRECYELAKRITVILPCAMPYLCIVGGAEAAYKNAEDYPETLEAFLRQAKIVAAQNETAFYAKLLIT